MGQKGQAKPDRPPTQHSVRMHFGGLEKPSGEGLGKGAGRRGGGVTKEFCAVVSQNTHPANLIYPYLDTFSTVL